MTKERWDDDRLDALGTRLEIAANIAESNVRLIQALANVAVEAREERQQLANRVERIDDRMNAFDIRMDALGAKLDITANIAESNARVIQALANVAAEAREERQQLFERMDRQQANIEGLRIMIAEQQANMAEEHKIIMQQQDEIRGLQTENRRTLDILLNQRNQDDNPTN